MSLPHSLPSSLFPYIYFSLIGSTLSSVFIPPHSILSFLPFFSYPSLHSLHLRFNLLSHSSSLSPFLTLHFHSPPLSRLSFLPSLICPSPYSLFSSIPSAPFHHIFHFLLLHIFLLLFPPFLIPFSFPSSTFSFGNVKISSFMYFDCLFSPYHNIFFDFSAPSPSFLFVFPLQLEIASHPSRIRLHFLSSFLIFDFFKYLRSAVSKHLRFYATPVHLISSPSDLCRPNFFSFYLLSASLLFYHISFVCHTFHLIPPHYTTPVYLPSLSVLSF